MIDLSPRVWPSYSDLARSLGVRLTSFKRLRPVDRLVAARVTRKVGNEIKVPPAKAVDLLTEAGLSAEAASREVSKIVQRRMARVPALADDRVQGLVPSTVGSMQGNALKRVFYAPPNRPTGPTQPGDEHIRGLHRRLAGRFVPVEDYLRSKGE
ncbi:MAG TPA: hypothetical protein VK009_05845 [Chloroflexota bacterium]|nr:hypothetical protein [Chloroflexota bacterium]